MNAVTASDVRGWSLLDFAGRGFPAPAGADPDPLNTQVLHATVWVEETSGRKLGDIEPGTNLEQLAKRAIWLKVESQVVQASDDYMGDLMEDALDISVSGYSQKRVDPRDRNPRLMVHPSRELHETMWFLMTEEAKDEFLSKYRTEPAEEWTNLDYDVSAGL